VKIYTKTGDAGETSFFDNTRVSKADARVDAYGEVDELNSFLGLVRTKTPEATEQALMRTIPRESWLHVNELFIRFGKDLCRPIGPRCDACSFSEFCRYYRTVVVPTAAARRRATRRRRA